MMMMIIIVIVIMVLAMVVMGSNYLVNCGPFFVIEDYCDSMIVVSVCCNR